MSYEEVVGDLFAQRDVDALGQGVNCEGLMGAGIAAEFARRFPDMRRAYQRTCRSGELTVGGLFPWSLGNGRWIYNLASQDRRGQDARLEAIGSSLAGALSHAGFNGVASLAVPQIGCGIGGLAWRDVRVVLRETASASNVHVRVVTYEKA